MANDYDQRLLRVLDYVYEHLDGDLSLDALSDVAALSRFHFHRVFTAITGESIAVFIRRVRLHRAGILLLTTDRTVAEIAATVGYPNPKSFARTFREGFGRTPAEFRAHGTPLPPLRLGKQGVTQMYDVQITDEPDRRLAVVSHRGSYLGIGQAFDKAGTTVMARGMGPNLGAMLGVYFSDPQNVAEEDLESAAGFEIAEGVEIAPPLEELRLLGGKHAVLRHVGPYTGLAAAYQYLYADWLPGSGEVPRDGPPWELYVNTPMDTAPETLVTLIGMPLA
ncbi:GyrI-like domain-containing protein [Maritimibacter sp. DP1N21-5]|uniref:AraC family transcriptional regulator n=1 Tax=Maritimibacter sp. DP1N21-5 TaxID=2836867 RepID=UPI001C46A2AD|nr:AraC family transcriptional regulator [Maritimibacter sp. DP1N21-5]MBV7408386.1 AraC family transcriptional regulator [Maritimibacter sp. DP1N21-5]